tara:strand:+ start:1402 stop:1761 length:360 start_codon:yes stop_codon:yes gene_type:complete
MTKVSKRKIKSLEDRLKDRLKESFRMLYSLQTVEQGLIEMHNNLRRSKCGEHTLEAFGCSIKHLEDWERKVQRQEQHCKRSVNMIFDKLDSPKDVKSLMVKEAMVRAKSLSLYGNYGSK